MSTSSTSSALAGTVPPVSATRRPTSYRFSAAAVATLAELEEATGVPRSPLIELGLRMLLAGDPAKDLADVPASSGAKAAVPVTVALTSDLLDHLAAVAGRLGRSQTELAEAAVHRLRWSDLRNLSLKARGLRVTFRVSQGEPGQLPPEMAKAIRMALLYDNDETIPSVPGDAEGESLMALAERGLLAGSPAGFLWVGQARKSVERDLRHSEMAHWKKCKDGGYKGVKSTTFRVTPETDMVVRENGISTLIEVRGRGAFPPKLFLTETVDEAKALIMKRLESAR